MAGGMEDLRYLAKKKDRVAMGLAKPDAAKSKPDPRRGNQIYAPSGKSATDGKGSVKNGMWSPDAPAKKTAKKSPLGGHRGK